MFQVSLPVSSKVTPLFLIDAAGTVAICGGNNGQSILDKFFLLSFKKRHGIMQDPQITEMPPMIHQREEFALVMGPDHKLYALGGYNQQEYLRL